MIVGVNIENVFDELLETYLDRPDIDKNGGMMREVRVSGLFRQQDLYKKIGCPCH